MRPNRLIVIGFLLVLAGAVLPFLMVIRVLPASLWLSFVSYASSVIGIFLGLIGAATLYGERKRRDHDFMDEAARHTEEPPGPTP